MSIQHLIYNVLSAKMDISITIWEEVCGSAFNVHLDIIIVILAMINHA